MYLEDKGLSFGSLTCSDVLLHPTGRVTLCASFQTRLCEETNPALGGQHNCIQSVSKKDIRRLGKVMMELMEGYVKDSGSLGLDNPKRWSLEALHFLSATETASSAKELLDVCAPTVFLDCY